MAGGVTYKPQDPIPTAGTELPLPAGTQSQIGAKTTEFARADHTHEVRARRRRVTLVAGTGINAGKFVATWVFDKPFATKPIIVCSPEDDGGAPVFVAAISASFTQNAAELWTGVTVRGVRQRNLPTLTGLIPPMLNGALASFDTFGASAAGVIVGLTAAEETPTTP